MERLQCLQRQLEEVEVLRAVYPEPGSVVLADTEQEAMQAAAAAVDTANSANYITNLSGLVRLPGLQLWGAPVGLRYTLPSLYPDSATAVVSVDCSAPRAVHQQLSTATQEAATSVHEGECSLLVVLQALQAAAEEVLTEHPEAAADSAGCQRSANVAQGAGPSAAQQGSSTILRTVVWFHHIKSTTKRRQLVSWARELGLRGCSKPGFPGVLVCEGLEPNVREYLARVRSQSWQAMQVRGEQLVTPNTAAATQKQQRQPDSEAWAFPAGASFHELPETGMSQLGQLCKDAGLEQLFLAALKIDKQSG